MRQFPKVLFLLCAAIAVPLGAETISEHEPTRFDPYREPAQPLSLAPHWIARTQQFSNFAPLANSNVGRVQFITEPRARGSDGQGIDNINSD